MECHSEIHLGCHRGIVGLHLLLHLDSEPQDPQTERGEGIGSSLPESGPRGQPDQTGEFRGRLDTEQESPWLSVVWGSGVALCGGDLSRNGQVSPLAGSPVAIGVRRARCCPCCCLGPCCWAPSSFDRPVVVVVVVRRRAKDDQRSPQKTINNQRQSPG